MLIHGTGDEMVPVEDSIMYEQALKEAGCEVCLRLIEGAGHTYDSLQWETEVIALTLDWFYQKL